MAISRWEIRLLLCLGRPRTRRKHAVDDSKVMRPDLGLENKWNHGVFLPDAIHETTDNRGATVDLVHQVLPAEGTDSTGMFFENRLPGIMMKWIWMCSPMTQNYIYTRCYTSIPSSASMIFTIENGAGSSSSKRSCSICCHSSGLYHNPSECQCSPLHPYLPRW